MVDQIISIINKFIPDQDQANQLAASIEREMTKQMELKSDIIKMETANGSGKWRVRLMYLCMFLVCAHWVMYDLIPYIIELYDLDYMAPSAPDAEHLWTFLNIGIGGYIGSRGAEKIAAHIRGK